MGWQPEKLRATGWVKHLARRWERVSESASASESESESDLPEGSELESESVSVSVSVSDLPEGSELQWASESASALQIARAPRHGPWR